MLILSCRWRTRIRHALSPKEKKATPAPDTDVKTVEDEDEKVLNEMEELTYAMERKRKQEKKRLAKKLAKVCCNIMTLSSVKKPKKRKKREGMPLFMLIMLNISSRYFVSVLAYIETFKCLCVLCVFT